MKPSISISQSVKKALAFDYPPVNRFVNRLLTLSYNQVARRLIRLAFIFASTSTLFLLIPFYPVYVALLLGVALGALGILYPRGALILGIFLSIPSAVYQETAATPLLIGYILVCILPLAATSIRWVNGFVVLASIELALIPQLSFLSFLPILIVGLTLSAEEGATAGLCGSLAIFLLVIIGGPLSGLITIPYRHTLPYIYADTGWRFPLLGQFQNWQPISIGTFFGNYAKWNNTANTHWQDAFSVAGKILSTFLHYTYSWVIPGLWCVSGYLTFKMVQWYKKLTSFAYVLASLTATIFPVVGELTNYRPNGIALILGAFIATALTGFALNIFYVYKDQTELTDEASAIGSKLDNTGLAMKEISMLGIDVQEYEKKLEELQFSAKSIAGLCQDRRLNEASTLVKTLQDQTEKLSEEATLQRSKLVHLDAKSKEVGHYLNEAKRTFRRAKKLFPRSDVSDEEKELETIQKSLAETQDLAQTGHLQEASTKLDELLKESETLDKDASEILELWGSLPVWTRAIETRLAEEGKVNLQAMEEIPSNWKKYALYRFMKEKEDLGLEFKNGTLYLPKTKSPITGTQEQKVIPVEETPRVKPSPFQNVDSMVLNYIQAHSGTVSLFRTAKDLNLTKDQLDASIRRLKQKGALE